MVCHTVVVAPGFLRFSKTCDDGRALSNRGEYLRCVGAFTREVARDVACVFQKHYLIITETYQRDDVRESDMQRHHFQNCYIFASVVASLVTCLIALFILIFSNYKIITFLLICSPGPEQKAYDVKNKLV